MHERKKLQEKKQQEKEKFEEICDAIKKVKIQGAENVAKAALEALRFRHDKYAIKKLIALRPTEPTLRNAIAHVLTLIEKRKEWSQAIDVIKKYFDVFDVKLEEYAANFIPEKTTIYTHCHSNTVEKILKLAKQKGKEISVYVTETRPLFQGRKTAENLAKAGIKVVLGVDSNAREFIKKADMFLFGADVITSSGDVINKIGTGMFAEIAQHFDVPCYCASISLKFDPVTKYGFREIIEERLRKEVWDKKMKNLTVVNPAFERVDAKHINAIMSEFGILSPQQFVMEAYKLWEDRILERLEKL